jgi:hypothetical protein
VNDHVNVNSLVADVLLYERLVASLFWKGRGGARCPTGMKRAIRESRTMEARHTAKLLEE